jgi:hypothetical protein
MIIVGIVITIFVCISVAVVGLAATCAAINNTYE